MNSRLQYTRFAAKAFPSRGDRPRELMRTMAAHPLSFQELPYDPEYTLYNKRLTPESLNHMTDDEMNEFAKSKMSASNGILRIQNSLTTGSALI